ncbi:hypothetical protein PCANC_03904 [Puccinia coronata f. sp. avenae]|uniref:Uncharacterized protein n=1 Tax=Puccinia coronata f. sp. avenae TaxID=200324 RepID=A0A2N5W1E2_9BASI|nr:hypothetical protein PCANC_03904 [Puccinia coronata f. sp. avenae]
MDAVNATILKKTIEAILVLTKEKSPTWKTRITALFKLGGLKDQIVNGEPPLQDVNSFSTFSSNHLKSFILDSGSTLHMVSDKKLFINLDKSEKGVINTSC